MASGARTRPSRPAASRTRIRRSATSRVSRNSATGSSGSAVPFHLPVGVLLDQDDKGEALPHSPCVRCDAFDGYPCPTNGKADAQIMAVDPALRAHDNLTLMTRSLVEKLLTDASGRAVTGVMVLTDSGERLTLSADIVVVACGALSAALLLLRSPTIAIRPDWRTVRIRSGGTACGTTIPP